ncbi:MAG: hypothetical protein U0003_01255 [Vampirovibrionales bacterium]
MTPWFVFNLLGLFLLTFVGGGAIPMPVSLAVVALAAQHHQGADTWWVFGVATVGAVVGWYLMGTGLYYHMPTSALQTAQQATPTWLKRLTQQFPNASVFLINALPLPWDPVRLILVAHQVHPRRFIMPLALGRAVRYAGLIWLGSHLARFKTVALLLTLVLVASIGVKVFELVWQQTQSDRRSKPRL